MRIDTLPASLKDRALWCVWKYEQRDGKPTKVPYNPRTGGRAQSNNPATFSPPLGVISMTAWVYVYSRPLPLLTLTIV